jgi:DNA-directed RNA polymerase alpha subunit
MKEDIVEFVLGLKKVRFVGSADKSAKATIEVSKAGEFTAADIKVTGGRRLLTPNLFWNIKEGSKFPQI